MSPYWGEWGKDCLLPFAFLVPRTVGLKLFRVFGFKCSGSANNTKNEHTQKVSFRADSQSIYYVLLYFMVLLFKQKLFKNLIHAWKSGWTEILLLLEFWHLISDTAHPLELPHKYLFQIERGGFCMGACACACVCMHVWFPPGTEDLFLLTGDF